ncbi:MAG: RodZ domain-containing protein [Aliishimia sp.]
MISFRSSKRKEEEVVEPKGFDAFELRLGDIMRGERATMGKSLLDVQRELRIKASYIAAIENSDPEAFDTPGFIAGYVRSYARYLNMDPDKAFNVFCEESGFEVAHGMSAQASVVRKPSREDRLNSREPRDMFASPATPFVPTGEALFSRIEPGAIGSMLVLIGLISAIGYGGYAVLQEVQRVQVTPVEQTPIVLSDIDPLAGVQGPAAAVAPSSVSGAPHPITAPGSDALDRLYRPQALDVPVLTARDAPIATLDPRTNSAFATDFDGTDFGNDTVTRTARADEPTSIAPGLNIPKVVEDLGPTIRMVAAYTSWVRVRSAEGNVLFETTMEAGDTYDIPANEVPPTLRTGESGAIYFAMGTDCYGPVGGGGVVTSNLALDRLALADRLVVVEPNDSDNALNRMFADLRQIDPGRLSNLPCQTN